MICFNDVLLLQVLLFTRSCMQFFFLFVWFVSFLEAIFFFSWRVWPWRKCVMTFVQFGFQFFFPFHFGGSVIISLFCNFFYWLFGIVCVYLWWFHSYIKVLDFFIYLFIYLSNRWSIIQDWSDLENHIEIEQPI